MIASLGDNGFLATYANGGGVSITLQLATESLELSLVDHVDEYLAFGRDNVNIPKDTSAPSRTEIHAGRSTVALGTLFDNLTFLFGPSKGTKASFGSAQISGVREDVILSSNGRFNPNSLEPYPADVTSWPNRYSVSAAGLYFHLIPESVKMVYEGPFFILISDATVQIQNATGYHEVRTGSWRETDASDSAGLRQTWIRHHHAALFGNVTGRIEVAYTGPFANLLAPTIDIADVRRLSVPIANATIDLPPGQYSTSGDPYLDIVGAMSVGFHDPGDEGQIIGSSNLIQATVSGDILAIHENRIAVRLFPTAATSAAVAGIGLLVTAYVAISWIRRGAVYVAVRALEWKVFTWVPFAAKLDLAKVLEHPVRQGIMQMLSGPHAMTNLADLRREVASAFGISTMAAYLHLRTLWRANHLTVVRLGSQHYIGPNSGGMGPKEQRVAASLLHEPLALAAAQYICAHPGATQGDVIAHVQKFCTQDGKSPSRGVVLKWLGRLETTTVVPTHLVRAFGRSLNRDADPKDTVPVPVNLVKRVGDAKDARVVRYEPSDVLYDVVKTFLERRPELGTALTELTRVKVLRRNAPPATDATPRDA